MYWSFAWISVRSGSSCSTQKSFLHIDQYQLIEVTDIAKQLHKGSRIKTVASGHIISTKMVLPTNIKLIGCSFTPIELWRCSVLSMWVGQFIQELNRGLKCERVSFALGDRDDVCNTCVGLCCVQHSSVNMSQPRVLILPVSGTDGLTGWEKEGLSPRP